MYAIIILTCVWIVVLDEIKWQIRMPKSFAMREQSLIYKDRVQDEILAFVGKSIKHDYIKGSRDINLDLTVSEAQQLYNADAKLRTMADSGSLQELHQRCADLAKNIETGYIKVMDSFDRVIQ